MYFDEIFRPLGDDALMSSDQMRKARINRWGTDTPSDDAIGKPLPGTGYEPSLFEGFGGAWQGLNAALAETKSSALTALSELPIGTEQEREGWLRAARATRAYSKAHYEADPEIMGQASQIIHGLWRMIPKAAGYSAMLGPAGGAVAFGADVGINESQKLKDEGVDQNTRTWAGVTSFAANAIGLRLPAAIGSTRLRSTLYGGLANIGTDSFERKGIQFILERQDYTELAKQYDLNATDMAVSGAFGAFFGAAAWRRPPTKLELDTQARREALKRDLMATGRYTEEESDTQAGIHAKGEVLFARDAGADWKDVAYTINAVDEVPHASDANFRQIIGENGASSMDYMESHPAYVNLNTARQMEGEGKTTEQIRLSTGWERGADGKWRYEIPDMTFREDAFSDLEKLDNESKARQDALLDSVEGEGDEYFSAVDAEEARRKSAVVLKRLGQIVDAPELFTAYPELRYMMVEFGPLEKKVGGYYDPEKRVIRLPNDTPSKRLKSDQDLLKVLVHEVQHAIQHAEGFTSGSSPKAFPTMGEDLASDMARLLKLKKSENYKRYRRAIDVLSEASDEDLGRSLAELDEVQALPDVKEILDEQRRLIEKWGMDQDVVSAINNAISEFDPIFKKISDTNKGYQYKQYLSVAGEVEARNVSRRLGLSDEERQRQTLESTEDVPRSEQITGTGRFSLSESRDISDPLITVHNISSDNLLKADALGGLAVPSLGVTKADRAYTDFGDITLIGTRGMVDPKSGVPVYSQDAYTNRFPKADWSKSVNKGVAKKLSSEVAKWEKQFGEDDVSLYYALREPDRDRFIAKFAHSDLSKLAFLDSKGVRVEPVLIKAEELTPLHQSLSDKIMDITENYPQNEWRTRISQAYMEAVDAQGDKARKFDKRRADKIRAGENLEDHFVIWLQNKINSFDPDAKGRVDKRATSDKIADEISKRADEYQSWVNEKTKDVFGDPKIRVGNKLMPITLENVVKAMTMRNVRNAERTLTFGPGKVRAASAKKFRNIEDIQKSRDQVVGSEESNATNAAIDARMTGFADSLSERYKGNGFMAHDAAMEILADSAKGSPTRAKMRALVESRGFENVPDEVLDEGVSILKDLKKSLTDYFEAKPQRAVKLDEFAGAVVPEGSSPELVATLERHGLKVKTYKAEDKNARRSAVKNLAADLNESKGDVFYQSAYHGTAYTFDKFTLDHIGSGEGVQAHGWGLYFSLERQIAEGYRSRVTSFKSVESDIGRAFSGMDVTTREGMSRALTDRGEKLAPATRELLEALQESNWLGHENPMDAVQLALVAQIGKGKQTARVKAAVDAARNNEGNVYKVEIPEDDVMLREELPLSQQPETVQKAVRALLTDEDVQTQSDYKSRSNLIEDVEPARYVGKRLDDMTGKEILAALIEKYGSAKAASLALKKHGLKGYRYTGTIDGECAVVFDDAAIEMRNVIEKAVEDGTGVVQMPDGSYQVRGAYDPSARRIYLTPKADISTFAHEHSHWYLDMLMRVLNNEKVDPDLKEAAMALLRHWGINSVEEWNALGVEGQRKFQEQFAAYAEIYLSKGKSPVRGLEGIFERFGKWLVELYKSVLGRDDTTPVETAVKERYKKDIGEVLPPLSKEVEAVIKRMYGQQERVRSVKPSRAQVVAARVAQVQRATEEKTTAPFKNPRSVDAYEAAQRATRTAVEQINDGKPVDVAAEVRAVEINDVALTNAQKNFARAVQMSDDSSSMVVLQNRDRSSTAPVGQMNSIAANPQYGRMSFSRTTDTGAPIVSFGSLPDVRYQGMTDFVVDGGERVPVTYAVVEADSVLTSNTWNGRAIEGYGEDASLIHAIAGNGRMAGLTEAYNRGTAGQYVSDMITDANMTGIDPQAIRELKRPALVRFIPNEKVTTSFIDRSNQSQVLEMSGKERAVQDASKLSTRQLQEYSFDENGDPTRKTLERFVSDIGEPSALGSLIDSSGNPTEAAKTRIKAALFFAAYRDPELTSLVSVETDKQGIKRILNAMAAFAPHVINIRESSGGLIDLGPGIVKAVHLIRDGTVPADGVLVDPNNPLEWQINPVEQQFFELLYENRNSAAAIGRIFGEFSDMITKSLGEGSGMLIGDPLDLADAMGFLRHAQNAEIKRLIEEGKTGLSLLPDIDIESVRRTIQATQNAQTSAKDLVNAMGEKISQDSEQKTDGDVEAKPEPKVDLDPMAKERARAFAIAGKDADIVRLENLAAERPEQTYTIDDNGTQMTMDDVFAEMNRVEQEADIEAAGIGKATECILRNGGIEQ